MFEFEKDRTTFEKELCTNNDHFISKMYNLLLNCNIEDEQVKNYDNMGTKHGL